MTNLADAYIEHEPLEPFEGVPVLRAAIEIPSIAGGLREAMKFEPVQLHHDDEGFLALKFRVKKVRFDPVKDVDGLVRVHVLEAVEVSFVEEATVRDEMERRAAAVKAKKDRAEAEARRQRGEVTIEEEILSTEHEDGQHASGLREGCPACDEERDAAEAEGGFEEDQ